VSIAGLDVDLDRIAEICRRYGVKRLDVFGSFGRGEQRAGSDVDLLYELEPDARLGWEIEDLADELSAALGRPVDLVARTALHARLREAALGEARQFSAA
jgi:predicted nucleotidyltransferase